MASSTRSIGPSMSKRWRGTVHCTSCDPPRRSARMPALRSAPATCSAVISTPSDLATSRASTDMRRGPSPGVRLPAPDTRTRSMANPARRSVCAATESASSHAALSVPVTSTSTSAVDSDRAVAAPFMTGGSDRVVPSAPSRTGTLSWPASRPPYSAPTGMRASTSSAVISSRPPSGTNRWPRRSAVVYDSGNLTGPMSCSPMDAFLRRLPIPSCRSSCIAMSCASGRPPRRPPGRPPPPRAATAVMNGLTAATEESARRRMPSLPFPTSAAAPPASSSMSSSPLSPAATPQSVE